MNIIKDLLTENDRICAEQCALSQIAEYYGTEKQLRQLQEECAELIQAVSKCCRYPDEGYETHLMEEICDVMICIDQIQLNEPEWQWSLLETFRKKKIRREMQRIAVKQRESEI